MNSSNVIHCRDTLRTSQPYTELLVRSIGKPSNYKKATSLNNLEEMPLPYYYYFCFISSFRNEDKKVKEGESAKWHGKEGVE